MTKTRIDLYALPIHPGAAAFRMMTTEELQELAEDIRENGQKDPIVLSSDGAQIVDGRNRLAACQIAGVEPIWELLNPSEDIPKYIASKNVYRRNLLQGQQAMGVVVLKSLEANGYGPKAKAARELGISRTRVSQAVTVKDWAPEQVEGVIEGAIGIDKAYEVALTRKREQDTADKQVAEAKAALTKLRADAPDLADLVADQRMPIEEAQAAYKEREARQVEERARFTRSLTSAMKAIDALLRPTDRDTVALYDAEFNSDQHSAFYAGLWTAAGLRNLAVLLTDYADRIDERRGGKLA